MDYKKLKEIVKKYSDSYYKDSVSLVSDEEYDNLMKELVSLEEEQGFFDLDSPTQIPGSDLTNLKTLKHKRPMLSLQDFRTFEEIEEWYRKMSEYEKNPEVVVELKYDGMSGAVRFKKGKIMQALTRGNGEIGEDITTNVSLIKDFEKMPLSWEKEVRGELLMTKKEFERLNKDGKYACARNLASGTLKLLDEEKFKERELIFFAYWLEESSNKKHSEDLEELIKNNFKVGTYFICRNLQEIKEAITEIENMKKDLDFEIDGAVLKINKKDLWEKIGSTAKNPKWSIAYKYQALVAETVVNDIEFWVARTGKVTPVAILKPVFLAGSNIQKATLSNDNCMKELKIRVGDTVKVRRACEIVPEIFEVVSHAKDSKVPIFPKICPECGSELKKKNEAHADYYCLNENCPARIVGKIVNFTHTLDIDGFAEILVERLREKKLLCSISDLYKIEERKEQFFSVERLGKKTVENMIKNINAHKNVPLEKFIQALGIPNVGAQTAKALAKKFLSLEKIMEAEEEEIKTAEDIGPIISLSIKEFFQDKENKKLVDFLQEKILIQNTLPKKEEFLFGKTFCITGKLNTKTREEYYKDIESNGGSISESVSSKTSFLVTNDENSGSSKNLKAKELGITIINEEKLKNLLKQKI